MESGQPDLQPEIPRDASNASEASAIWLLFEFSTQTNNTVFMSIPR